MTNLVTDTNFWYDVADGTVDVRQLKRRGYRLCSTAVNAFELISSERPFSIRQKSASELLKHSDEFLEFTERILIEFFGIEDAPESPQWREIAIALAGAASENELDTGVSDPIAQVRRTVRSKWATNLRKDFTEAFAVDMAKSIGVDVPNYEEYVSNKTDGQKPAKLRGKKKNELIAQHDSEEPKQFVTYGLYLRASLICQDFGIEPPTRTPILLEAAENRFMPYIDAYLNYRKALSTTGRKPRPNDWYDLEQFLYVVDGCRFATREEFWISLCKENGKENYVFTNY